MFFYFNCYGYKFSFRSERSDIHAGELAEIGLSGLGNGGGHAIMAGGFVGEDKLPKDEGTRYETIQDHFIDIIREKWPQILENS